MLHGARRMISSVDSLLTRIETPKAQNIVNFLKYDVYYVQLNPFHVSRGTCAYLTAYIVYGKESGCPRTMTIQNQLTFLAL